MNLLAPIVRIIKDFIRGDQNIAIFQGNVTFFLKRLLTSVIFLVNFPLFLEWIKPGKMKSKIYIFIFAFILIFNSAQAKWVDLGSRFPDTLNTPCLSDIYCIGDTCWITSCMPGADILYYSANGCQSFVAKSIPDQFNAVHFLSPYLGYAASQSGHVYKTIDGGNTWNFHGLAGGCLFLPAADELDNRNKENDGYL